MPVDSGFRSPVSSTRTTCASRTITPCPRFQSPHAVKPSAATAATRANRSASATGVTWAERYRFDPSGSATHGREWVVLMRRNVYLTALLALALVTCGGLPVGQPQGSALPAGTYRGVGTGAG